MLRRDDQIVRLRYEHLNEVETVAEIVLTCVQRLLLDNLINDRLIVAGPDLRTVQTVTHLLLIKCLARARR